MGGQFHLLLSALHPVFWKVSSTALPLMLLGSALPLFFAGLGGRESLAVLLLRPYGVPAGQAVLAALLLFGVSGLLPGMVGWFLGFPWKLKSLLASTVDNTLSK